MVGDLRTFIGTLEQRRLTPLPQRWAANTNPS